MNALARFTLPTLAAACLVGVAACGSDEATTSTTSTTPMDSATSTSSSSTSPASQALTLEDGWVKALPTVGSSSTSGTDDADDMGESMTPDTDDSTSPGTDDMNDMDDMDMSTMTGMFGTLRNNGDKPIRITAVSTPAAGKAELHETVGEAGAMTMRPVKEFVVPANGTFDLEPGANHIMLLEVPKPIAVGDDVTVTLETDAGPITLTAPARAFTGAEESYAPESS